MVLGRHEAIAWITCSWPSLCCQETRCLSVLLVGAMPSSIYSRAWLVRKGWVLRNMAFLVVVLLQSTVCPDIQTIEVPSGACHHSASSVFIVTRQECTISFGTHADPGWFHRRQPPSSEPPPVSEALGFRQEALELALTCDVCVLAGVGVSSSSLLLR